MSMDIPDYTDALQPEDGDAERRGPEKDYTPVNRFLVHKPLTYGKKIYIGEFLTERFVQAIAFLSIAAILAIFYYVFQESTWAFRGKEESTVVAPASGGKSEEESLKSETYDPGPTSEGEALKPETYGPAPVAVPEEEALKPESYGAPVAEPSATAASSLDEGREASQSLESSGNDTPVTARQLLSPNDTIDGEPRYIWQPIGQVPKYSFIPLFVGALKVTLIALLIAAPLAILAAIFTVAFAPRWSREIMKPAIEILAGFPSVVIGFFALMTLATVIQQWTGAEYRLNSFVGGVGMALAVIPIIYTVTEDALSAVPKFMKEASLALGASRWQTAWRVLLPAATPGVFAAVILGFGRAFGETMIALMATGNAALTSFDLFESVRTMSATIGAEMAEVEFHSVHYGILFLIGSVLFVVTFSLNALAEFYVRNRLLKRFQGK